jgi:cellulose synthase/poly-beta-1,6-N-acetylglucosamine synthase-like glycosyltransferase
VVIASERGLGDACWAGLQAGTAEVVAFMEADASLDPQQLHRVVDPVLDGRADLVLGARVPQKGSWPAHARLGNYALARQVRRRTGVPLTDLGPMCAARRDCLLSLDLRDRRSGWPLEILLKAVDAGWRVCETRVGYLPRKGRSKVTGTVRGTVDAIRDMRLQLDGLAP